MKKRIWFVGVVILSVFLFFFAFLAIDKNFDSSKEDSTIETTKSYDLEEREFNKEKIYVSVTPGQINLYKMNEGESFIGYTISNEKRALDSELTASNFDVWRLTNAAEYRSTPRDKFFKNFNITNDGEWEMAIMEKGANDFVGGSTHGDEINKTVKMYIDGEERELNELNGNEEADQFVLETTSDLYRDNTITEKPKKIGTHEKVYTFDIEGLVVEQKVEFEEALTIERAYLAMLPILRTNGDKQITDTAISDGDESVRDVSTPDFAQEYVEAYKAEIKGEESGVIASVEVLDKSPSTTPTFFVSNEEAYNKLYFTHVEDGYEVSEGEQWSQKTYYDIEYKDQKTSQ